MDVDLKLASRVTGLDAILGGHTHDGIPHPVEVKNTAGITLVTNAGSNTKFLGVLDFDVREGRIKDWRYRLLPVFANLLAADPSMQQVIATQRAPFKEKLAEELAVSEGLLYRRGNFNGSFDQVILDALLAVQDAEIAFSPGFRWGTSLLPGETITLERLLDQTAITYPAVTVNEFTGERIKAILEDVADNLFNPDPYYQQGGDMVRVGGLGYTCEPAAPTGRRISELRLAGKPLDPTRTYKVAGWASVAEHVEGPAIWEVVAEYLRAQRTLAAPALNLPTLRGVEGNPGIA
jgi:sulfur-oxidizing protein SoxB